MASAAAKKHLEKLTYTARRAGPQKWYMKQSMDLARVTERVGTCLKIDLGVRAVERASHLNGGVAPAVAALREAESGVHYRSAIIDASDTVGSDINALVAAAPTERATYYRNLAHLLRTLSESELPTVAVLDGCVSGGGIGIGAHANACVVTERTRASLPGATHGFVPEGFVAYQLSRLALPGVGAYLALTGASLSGAEMHELGLATNITESQTVGRVINELRHQRARHLGRALRCVEVACIEPRDEEVCHARMRGGGGRMRAPWPRADACQICREIARASRVTDILLTKALPHVCVCARACSPRRRARSSTRMRLRSASPSRRSRPSWGSSTPAPPSGTPRQHMHCASPRL